MNSRIVFNIGWSILHHFGDKWFDVVELVVLNHGLIIAGILAVSKLLIQIGHMLLEVDDLLVLRDDGVGDGSGGGLQLLIDAGDFLVDLCCLLEPIKNVRPILLQPDNLLELLVQPVLDDFDSVSGPFHEFVLKPLSESRYFGVDASASIRDLH